MNYENINPEIDRLLAERRPDRFVVGDSDEPEATDEAIGSKWLDEIARDIEARVDPGELRRFVLSDMRARVRAREGVALKSVNSLLRQYDRSGQWPLFAINEPAVNGHLLNLPLGVVTRSHHSGEHQKVVREHVAFRAVMPDDLRKFAQEERRRTANESAARYESCNGAERLADEMDIAGAVTFGDWWQRPPEAEEDED